MIERRISAILAILIGAIYAQGLYLGLRANAWQDGTWRVLAIGALVPGILALAGRATILLPVVWGWMLGVHLPRLLSSVPRMPDTVVSHMGQRMLVVSPEPNYGAMAICAVAFIGLGLYLYGYYRENKSLS